MITLAKIITAILSTLILSSCSNEMSLQEYLVDKQDDNNFIKIDLAASLLKMDNEALTDDMRAALNTVKKINVVAFQLDETNEGIFEIEKNFAAKILSQEEYKTLIKFGSKNNSAVLKFTGDDENHIDELIVFATDNKMGFTLFRLLGDDIQPEHIMKLLQSGEGGSLDISKFSNMIMNMNK